MRNSDPRPVENDMLAALADAVEHRARPSPPPVKPWAGWRVVIFLMRTWAAVLFAAGLLLCVTAMFTVAVETRALRVEQTATSFRIYGWGPPAALALLAFSLSKLQSRAAQRLRARKLAVGTEPTFAGTGVSGQGG